MPIRRMVDSWYTFGLTVFALALFLVVHLAPADYWLKVNQISVGPAQAGHVVPMAVDRRIVRAYFGSWTVNVRQYGVAGWVAYCNAYGESRYEVGAELPQKLDLGWWTDGRCKTLPVGRYIVETTWRIYPSPSFLPGKTLTVSSNIFEVTP